MKIRMRTIGLIVLVLLIFAVAQLACDFSVGAVSWFVSKLPEGRSLSEFPAMAFWASPLLQFLMQWLAVFCLALSIYFFMEKRRVFAFLALFLPLLPALISTVSFYKAAQIHVPPGQELFASGVLIGKNLTHAETGEEPHEH